MKNIKLMFAFICTFLLAILVVGCGEVEVDLTLTADKTFAYPTETITLTTAVEASKDGDYEVVYEITKGTELATVSTSGVVTILETATNGGTVTVVSKYEDVTSNEITITIGVKVSSVTARTSKTTLSSGNAVSLNADVTPSNATNPNVEWVIVEGAEFGVVSGNVLLVNDNVGTDKIIKVKAVADGVSSNVLTFTINPFVLEMELVLTSDKVKAYAGEVVTFSTQVKANTEEYGTLTYEITEGDALATINAEGELTINSDANNGGTVKVVSKIDDVISNEVVITLGIKVTSVTASADSLDVLEGAAVTLKSEVLPANADNKAVSWSITEGSEYASIVGNVLIIKDNLESNITIKVKAAADGVNSNELTFNVSKKEGNINLVLTGNKNFAYAGEVINLTTTHNHTNDISPLITYTITSGTELAEVSADGKVTIKDTATNGGKVVVVSKYKDFISNEYEITIGVKVSSVTINANKTELASGNAVTLYVEILPANASNKNITWDIIEGEKICDINGNVLIIADDKIEALTTIKVKATVDGIESNVLEFTVNPDIVEINLVLTADKQLAFMNDVVTFNTVVKSEETVTDPVTYEIISGSELATITQDGKLTINSNNGGKVVVVSKIGDNVSNEIEITLGISVTELQASANKTEVTNGNVVTLYCIVLPENATNSTVTWNILEGQELCEINGNVIIIKDELTQKGVIKVQAVCGSVESNVITINVNPQLSLVLSADKNLVYPNGTVQFTTTVTPDGEYNVEYVIVSGSDLATIDENGLLTINETATNGGEVIVKSTVDGYTSNLVAIQVGINVTEVNISAQKESLLAGTSLVLASEVLPSNATNQTISWVIVEGSDLATIVGNVFMVNEGVKSGSVIKVKATADGVDSNVLTFTVEKTQEELNKENLYINLNSEEINVDKNGTSTPVLSANLFDGNLEEVTDKNVLFEVIEGSEFISLNQDGLNCTFNVLGHGTAIVRVTIEGTEVSEQATINAILPPTAIAIPEVFAERMGYNYNFGMRDSLPFKVTLLGTNVCDEYVVTFKDANGNTGDQVATYDYDTNEITFYVNGLVTVTVTSTSGSKLEATNSYTFNVNNGINVYTFEELRSTIGEKSGYAGEVVNIVVLEKPTTNAYDYEYGYDLVPALALKAKEDQTFNELILNHEASILIYGSGLYLNGNNHTIDGTHVRAATTAELNNAGITEKLNWSILYITERESQEATTHRVNIYDLNMKGNSGISYGTNPGEELNGVTNMGVYARCISIGNATNKGQYYVDMNNVNITNSYIGLSLYHVIEGDIRNLSVNNCFSNGVQCNASIATFTNITIGKCGATGLELGPTNSAAAGLGFNEQQKITFAGTISTDNYNAGNTVYMENYETGLGVTVAQIISGVISNGGYSAETLSNIRNDKGEFVFIAFLFNDLASGASGANYSVTQYNGVGIIKASELNGVNTTHKYIELDIPIAQLGGASLGKALLYNQNYQGN